MPKWKKLGSSLRGKIPRNLRNLDFDFKKIELKNVSQYSGRIRWGLTILAVFLAAEVGSRVLSLVIRPVYTPLPKKFGSAARSGNPTEDYDAILRRNIFNVEGKIPDPFDQGLLDCMSQAKPSTQNGLQLLGTIVMADERLSVALVQDSSSPQRIGVKKDEPFFDKYVAMKVERKKLCFQVKSNQELEFIEIPDETAGLGINATFAGGTGGIMPKSETEFEVKRNFLEEKLTNLTDILQTARAVPYLEPGTGKFKGFLVQSIDTNSPFAQLGIRQGDVLTGVNDMQLDNPGKGLEAFQTLRNSPHIALKVIRGGQETTLSFDVK